MLCGLESNVIARYALLVPTPVDTGSVYRAYRSGFTSAMRHRLYGMNVFGFNGLKK